MFLRIVLYGLPILAILGADALRALVRRRRAMEFVLAIGMALLFPPLILIRGGNDAYQVVYPQEVALARQVNETTPPGQEILPLSNVGPYGVEGIDTHSLGSVVEGCSELADDPIRCIEAESPDVLITFTSVEKQAVVLNDMQPGWTLEVIRRAGGVRAVRGDLPERFRRRAEEDRAGPGPDPGG